MPIRGQPIKTMRMPPRKNPVALSLCDWKKNANVLPRPMTNARPHKKRICLDINKRFLTAYYLSRNEKSIQDNDQ